MRSPRSRARGPRRLRPVVDVLERRDFPSIVPLLVSQAAPAASVKAAADTSGATPTRHEARRQAFYALYPARFTTGPGRFTDQRTQTFHQGEQKGNSNFFLVSELTLSTVAPKDPAQPVTGQAVLFDRNANNTGNILVLDLVNAGPVDKLGRPTKMTWTVNGSSGGSFSGAEGQGTLRLTYKPGGKVGGRVLASGRSALLFRGSVYTTGLSDLVRF